MIVSIVRFDAYSLRKLMHVIGTTSRTLCIATDVGLRG